MLKNKIRHPSDTTYKRVERLPHSNSSWQVLFLSRLEAIDLAPGQGEENTNTLYQSKMSASFDSVDNRYSRLVAVAVDFLPACTARLPHTITLSG